MKKHIQRLLFATLAILLGGANSAWAAAGDVTTNANIDFSNAITDGVVTGTVNSMTIGSGEIAKNGDTGWLSVYDDTCTVTIPEAQRAGSKDIVNIQFKTAWGNKNSMGFGFNLKDAEAKALAEFKYARWDGNSTNSNTMNINMSGLVGGHNSNKPIAARYTMFDITINYAAKTITSVVYCNNTDGKGTTATQTFNVSLTNSNPIATFNIFGYGVGGNTDRANIFDDLIIKTTEGDYSVQTYDYTVNWVCNDTPVKSITRQGEAGAAISLFDTDKAAFWDNDTKYFYVSDDASEQTVANNNSTVVTVTVREAESWNYTVNAISGENSVLGIIDTGSVVEGESASVNYSQYFLSEGVLYSTSNSGTNTYWAKIFTPSSDNFVYNITYTSAVENVVYFSEAEKIEGTTILTGNNANIRCSNCAAAYAASSDIELTTLPMGKYKIMLQAFSPQSAGGSVTIDAGQEVKFISGNSNTTFHTSDEIVLTKATKVVLKQGGGNRNGTDFIYIQKTGDYDPSIVQNDYLVDFNSTITTSNHNFAIAPKWGHIVPNSDYDGYGPYYMSYSYNSTAGIDGTGALGANRQYAGDYSGGETVYDLLVTPVVSGTITLQVKAMSTASSSNNAFVEFYSLNEDGTAKDELLLTVKEDIPGYNSGSNTDWYTATLEVSEAQKIGIRAQYVYLDNFTATSMKYIPAPGLTVNAVMNTDGQTGSNGTNPTFEQQSDGTMLVKLKVALENTGDIDFVAGETENYTLTVAQASYASGTKTYYEDASINVLTDLAVGVKDTIDVQFATPYVSGWKYWFVRENVTGTTSSSYRYATSVAYEPKFVFRAAGSTATSSITAAEAWGTITESTTKSFEIANTGTAPLTIKSITLPEGFTSDNAPTAQFVLAKGETQAINITQDATATGTFAGTLTIVYLDKDAAEQTYTLAFSTTVIGANTWTADFNNSTSTPVYPEGSVAEGGINSDYDYNSGTYNIWLTGRTQSSYQSENNKFITPKLHASAGAQLSYDVKGANGSSYYAKVYVSTDRKNWEQKAFYTQNATEGAEAIGYSDWFTKTLTFDTEGDYYVAFALYGTFKIDNLVGLEKVDVAHDLYIKSVSWPDASVKSGTSLSKPSVDIIPLTNEASDAYTVKYVCGETVLAEATSAALTASANSSKTFSFNWTPSVENTTVYENTKVVFDFGGGVTFETAPFTLTVTNEPKFHFVSTLPSSKWTEPTDVSTPIAFGKTNAAGSKTFYVYNWGSAPLTVKSVTVPAGFTVTPANQFVVAAFDESNMSAAAQAVEITFSATEAGTYSGDMVITYLNGAGEEQTFTLAVSGTKLDPTKWYANFGSTSGQWPAGSVYQSSVSTSDIGTYSDPDYAITSTSTTNNIFVTPKLTAVAGDKLMFDAKLYSSYWSEGKVVVYAAATREEVLNAEEGTTRVQLFSVSGEDETNPMTTDFQTFEVSVPAGEWYLGFEISGRPYVDEIYGLQQVTVAHDWQLAETSIVDAATQNTSTTASIAIRNFGLAAEAADAYTVTVYVDEEPVATTVNAVAIPVVNKLDATATTISATYKYGQVGTFPVYMIIEANGYKLKSEPVNVTFAKEEFSSDADMAANGTASDAPLNLNYKNSESVTLYNAAALSAIGIQNGSKISKITYKGYKTSDVQTTSFQVYYKWTDNQTLAQPGSAYPYDAEGMTNIIDEDHTWNKVGSSTELGDMIVLDFSSNPLVYTEGQSLMIYMHSYVDGYKIAYFEKSTLSTDYCYERQQDAASITYSWYKKNPAAIHISLVAEPATLAGTVKLGGSPVEGATVTLTSEDEDKVQYTGTTNASGEYSIEVIQSSRTYTVTADKDGAAATVENVSDFSAPVNLALVALPELTFGDADFSTTETKANVTVARTLKAGWNAIILPVTLTADEVTSAFGANAEVAVYSKDEDAENVTIQFSKTTKIVAGTPCLLWLEAAPATAPRFVNKDINTTVNKVSGQSFSFTGVYKATTVKAGDYFVKNGGFKKAGNNNTVKPFRSYLQLNEGASARSIRFFIDDEEIVESEITGIETVKQTVAPQGTYSMSGQKMEGKLRKGLYIINGKKVMVK